MFDIKVNEKSKVLKCLFQFKKLQEMRNEKNDDGHCRWEE